LQWCDQPLRSEPISDLKSLPAHQQAAYPKDKTGQISKLPTRFTASAPGILNSKKWLIITLLPASYTLAK